MYLSLVLGLGKKIGIKNHFLSAYTQANANFLPVKGKGLPVHVYGLDCTSHNVKRNNGHSFFSYFLYFLILHLSRITP